MSEARRTSWREDVDEVCLLACTHARWTRAVQFDGPSASFRGGCSLPADLPGRLAAVAHAAGVDGAVRLGENRSAPEELGVGFDGATEVLEALVLDGARFQAAGVRRRGGSGRERQALAMAWRPRFVQLSSCYDLEMVASDHARTLTCDEGFNPLSQSRRDE